MNIILLFPSAERDSRETKSEEGQEVSRSEKPHKGRHENENGRRMLQEVFRRRYCTYINGDKGTDTQLPI